MMPRGQGKTTVVAALGLYDLMLGDEGAVVVVTATDERQAGLCTPSWPSASSRISPSCGCPGAAHHSNAYPPSRNTLRAWTTRWPFSTIGVIGRDTYEVMNWPRASGSPRR
jgi:hypothetical protein